MICLSGLSSVIPMKFLQYFPHFDTKVLFYFDTNNFFHKEMRNLTLELHSERRIMVLNILLFVSPADCRKESVELQSFLADCCSSGLNHHRR